MSNEIIRAAFERRIKEWAAAQAPPVPLFLENRGKKPVIGARHVRTELMPAQPLNPSQGGKHTYFHGIYQVGAFLPENEGTGDSDKLSKAIGDLFKCPTTIVEQGLNVQVLQTPYIAQSRADGTGFWMTPITIKYSANDFS